jgi:transcriptional antiterminator
MNTENDIKSTILKLFNEGNSEAEAYKQLSKSQNFKKVSKKTVNSWYEKFKSENHKPGDMIETSEKKLSDEYLTYLINENSGLNMKELAKLAGTSIATLSNRLKQINSNGEMVYYISKKASTKLKDEFLIDLINMNPNITMQELARISGVSQSTISRRLKQINNNSEGINYTNKSSLTKVTNEFLIDLVNKNPGLTMTELSKLAGVSQSTISNRLKQINSGGERVNYIGKRSSTNFTDEFLIGLINQYPELNLTELAIIVGVSRGTISNRLKKINSNGKNIVYQSKNAQIDATKFSNEFLIDLVNKNPNLNMQELAKISGVSRSTISRRLEQINSNGEGTNYISKWASKKFKNEFLIDLINNNPGLSMKELAKLAGTSQGTISNRLKQVNGDNERISYISKSSPIKFTNELLIDLIKENPGLNLTELGKLACISKSTRATR